ncbi:hypothetical protein AAFF_G00230370 [Aldrovandia affinis]|uniref:Uncharacterized protein n=1 Tax=Aldrovandia affinis TaxID=143900 RepID=A0AAD7RFV0_9TELE|nr:hypothetical protein AAFF_G00230370 [Aldrovandia affinis]
MKEFRSFLNNAVLHGARGHTPPVPDRGVRVNITISELPQGSVPACGRLISQGWLCTNQVQTLTQLVPHWGTQWSAASLVNKLSESGEERSGGAAGVRRALGETLFWGQTMGLVRSLCWMMGAQFILLSVNHGAQLSWERERAAGERRSHIAECGGAALGNCVL